MKNIVNKPLLQKYLFNRWNVRVSDILHDLKIDASHKSDVLKLLKELVLEGWIVESYCSEDGVTEYDPGSLQGY